MKVIKNEPNSVKRTRLQDLEERLHHGDHMIRRFEVENKPVEHLEKHWLELLHEYEVEFRAEQTAA